MSTAMRLLIHYVGDVHQPLHASSRVDHEYPKGDRGGNDFPLPSLDGIKELHAVWDSVLYEFEGYATLPFSDGDWAKHKETATRLVNQYDIEDADAKNLDPKVWAQESFDISKNQVYTAKEGEALSDAYRKEARSTAEKRIVLAGHRLANLIQSFPLKASQPQEFLKDGSAASSRMARLFDYVTGMLEGFVY